MIQKIKKILLYVFIAVLAFSTTAFADRTFTLPNQIGHAGQFLQTNGTNPLWATAGGSGGVSSITGLDPIFVDNTDPQNPVVGITADGTIRVNSATTANITNVTYANGTLGVGATLTKTTGVFSAANFGLATLPAIGSRVLVKNQTTQLQNGVYVYTATTILTRATDSDTSAELYPQTVVVSYGTNQNTLWSQSTATPTVGTSNIVYVTTTAAAFVTQATTGTQVNGQIPSWNATARQLVKGDANLTWLSNLFTLNGSLKQDLTYLTNHYKTEASSNLFGTGAPGVGMYAGPNSIIAPSGSGAALAAVNVSGNFISQMSSYNATYDVNATNNANGGGFSYIAQNKVTNADSGFSAAADSTAQMHSSNNLLKNEEFLLNYQDETARLRNNANTNEAMHTRLDYNAPQKTAWNWNPSNTATSTLTHNGSFASNTTYVTADYVVDDNDPLVPDNTIAVFSEVAGTAVAIQMPSAADFIDREIGIYNVASRIDKLFQVRVSFVGTEFNGTSNVDYIESVPYEFKLYKAQRDDLGTPIWVLKYTNKTIDGYKLYNYDSPAVIASSEDGITYGFGEDPSTTGSPTLDISTTSAPNIPYGTKLTVKDIGNNASVMNITIDAGTDEIIQRNVINPTLVLSTDGGSYTLQKMYNGFNARTYWMVIASI